MQAQDIASILDGLGEMEFAKVVAFNEGHVGVFWSDAPRDPSEPGSSPWEMHPDTDELLMCVEGSVEIQILSNGGGSIASDLTKIPLSGGQFAVVPKGLWHRHHATAAFREFYLTPGRTEHSKAEDPRLPSQ